MSPNRAAVPIAQKLHAVSGGDNERARDHVNPQLLDNDEDLDVVPTVEEAVVWANEFIRRIEAARS